MKRSCPAALLLACSSALWAAPTYSVREVFPFDLPTDTSVYSSANAISGSGWVAAHRGQVAGGALAYRCKDACEQVPLLPGGHHGSVSAAGINDQGVVVGSRPMGPPFDRGYKWDGATLTELEPFTDECPGCFLSTDGRAVDKHGNVGGSGQGAELVRFAVLFRADGSRLKLPTLGGTWAEVSAMTHDGFLAGTAQRADGSWRAFVFDAVRQGSTLPDSTKLIELGTLGGSSSEANAVNAGRQVAGCSLLAGDTRWQGFIHHDQTLSAIPTLAGQTACAKGINRQGHVVGYESDGGFDSVGTLFMRGRIFDLNECLVDGDRATWSITAAAAINSSGQIAASARHRTTGARRAVVLEPVAR